MRDLDFGLADWRTIEFPLIHGDTKKLRFEFHNDRKMTGLQLGEIIFYHNGTGVIPNVTFSTALPQPTPVVMVQAQPIPQPMPVQVEI